MKQKKTEGKLTIRYKCLACGVTFTTEPLLSYEDDSGRTLAYRCDQMRCAKDGNIMMIEFVREKLDGKK